MEQTYNETLEYVIRLTPHIEKGDVPSAILMLLIDLGFHTSSDGFGYLRKAILLRCNDPDMQANVIYQEIAYMPRYKVSRKQGDQAIRNAISNLQGIITSSSPSQSAVASAMGQLTRAMAGLY